MVKVNGVTYNSVKECCNKLGLCYSTVTHKHAREKISYNVAIEKTIDLRDGKSVKKYYGNRKPFSYKGKMFDSIADCCRFYDLEYHKVMSYFNYSGEKLEDVIDMYIEKICQSLMSHVERLYSQLIVRSIAQ